MLAIIDIFFVFHAYNRTFWFYFKIFCTYFLQLFCFKLKKLEVYATFIHVFTPLVSYLYLSEKIFNAFCAIFICLKKLRMR